MREENSNKLFLSSPLRQVNSSNQVKITQREREREREREKERKGEKEREKDSILNDTKNLFSKREQFVNLFCQIFLFV